MQRVGNLGFHFCKTISKVTERIVYAKRTSDYLTVRKENTQKKVGVGQRTLHLCEKCQRRSRYLMKKKRNGKFFPNKKNHFKGLTLERQRGGKMAASQDEVHFCSAKPKRVRQREAQVYESLGTMGILLSDGQIQKIRMLWKEYRERGIVK